MRRSLAPAALVLCCGSTLSHAQPASFFDVGSITIPVAPAYASEAFDLTDMFDFDSGVQLTVAWARFELTNDAVANTFLDTQLFNSEPSTPVLVALYDNTGSLIAFDEDQGGWLGGGGLSFGSTSERVPFTVAGHNGQDGPLPAGTYWLAFVAGPEGVNATLGASNWNVSTTASIPLGFDAGEVYVSPVLFVGNTTPVAAPSNDNCASAIVLSEDIGAAPAWTGSNFGATSDGFSPCNSNLAGVTTKDIWFSYVPSQTGFAQIVGSTSGPDSNSAVISLYPGGCGSGATQCVGSGNFALAGGSRLGFPVVAGQPVLFSVAQRGGFMGGTIRLNIDLLPAPCNLTPPVGSAVIAENEACGTSVNNGCFSSPPAFGTLNPGDVVTGTLWTTASSRDTDWYLVDLAQPSTVTVRFAGEAALNGVIQAAEATPGTCFGFQLDFAQQLNPLSPCGVLEMSANVPAGVYRVAVAQTFLDAMSCTSGYSDYWLSMTTAPCDQPAITVQPEPQSGCVGGTVTYSVAASSPQPISYVWQIGIASTLDPNQVQWLDLYDGTLDYASSLAEVTGSQTDTLTISGLDEAAADALFFRVVATTCTTRTSDQASFTLLPAGSCTSQCDSVDFNNDGVFPDDADLSDFIFVLGGGSCATCNDVDFNNDGVFPDDGDLATFLFVVGGGTC